MTVARQCINMKIILDSSNEEIVETQNIILGEFYPHEYDVWIKNKASAGWELISSKYHSPNHVIVKLERRKPFRLNESY